MQGMSGRQEEEDVSVCINSFEWVCEKERNAVVGK